MISTEKPAAAPRIQMRFSSSGIGWLLVAIGVGAYAWFRSINLVVIITYTMIALIVLNAILAWRTLRRANASRIKIPPVFAGESAECGVSITNESRYPITLLITDTAGGHKNVFLVYRLPKNQSSTCTASREFPTRGRFSGPVTLSSGFPFGFIECERQSEAGGEIVVLPRYGYAEPDGLRRWLFRQGDGHTRRVLRRLTTDQVEVRGVRSYRPGDALRDIHWRTTARRGEIMVREYDTAPALDLILVVEAWLPPNPTTADTDRLEAALSLAVTIAVTWRRTFDSPVLVVVPGHSTAAAAASDEDLREVLSPLADIVGGSAPEPLAPETFHHHLARGARVVVSSRANTPYAAALTRSTGKPFIPVSPTDRLPWYQPPVVAEAKKPEEPKPAK